MSFVDFASQPSYYVRPRLEPSPFARSDDLALSRYREARRRWYGCGLQSTAAELRSEEHTSELQSPDHLVCRLPLEKKKSNIVEFFTLSKSFTIPGLRDAFCVANP